MKPKSRHLRSLAIASSALLSISYVQAQLQWDANNTGALQTDGAGTWTGANQWWNGAANVTWNSVTPDSATIGNGGAGGAISLGGNVTAGTIGLNSFTGSYTIQGTAHTLTINTGITIGSTAGTVTFRGTGASPNTLTISGAGGITMNGSGVLNMRENIVTNYTGQTRINNGVVVLNGGSKSTGNFYLDGGMLTDYFTGTGVFTSGLGAGANQIQIYGNSGLGAGNGTSTWRIGAANSTLVWGASGQGTATGFFNPTTFRLRASQGDNNGPSVFGNPVLDNRLDLNSGSRLFSVHLGSSNIGGSRATIDDGIQDTGGTGSLTLSGGGMLVIGGTTATWGGNTNVNAGILFLGGNSEANIGGGSARNITIASGAGIQFTALNNATLNRIVETTDEIGVMTGTTSNNLDFSSSVTGANLPNAFLGNYASNGAKMEYSGTITPGSNGYKLGAVGNSGLLGMTNSAAITGANTLTIGNGSVQLVGDKTFTGDTFIRNGARLGLAAFTGGSVSRALQNSVLDVGTASNTGTIWIHNTVAGEIAGSAATTSVVFGGLKGSRNLTSVYSTTTGANNSSAQAVTAITGFTLNTGTGVNVTYSGAIGGFGTGASGGLNGASTLTKTGAGTQVLSGASTYTGTTLISDGTLQIGAGGTTGALSISSVITTNANLTFNRSNTITQGTNFAAGIGGSGTVTQAGASASILVLSGTNTYAGGTLINGGIVQANTATALGGGDVTIGTGGVRLAVLDGVTLANDIVINSGAGVSGRGIIENTGAGNATLSGGTITINAEPAFGGHFASTGGGTLTVNHAINSASTNVTMRTGTVIFGGGGSYTSFTIGQGTARLGANNGLSTSAAVNIGPSAAGTLDLAGFNQSLAGITKSTNAATIGNSSTTSGSTLTITGTSTYSGIIADVVGLGTQTTALAVNGGQLTLTGNSNIYSGGTTVTTGTLLVNNTSGSGTGTGTVTVNGGTLGGSGTIGGAATVGAATLAPGTSPGTLNITNALILASTTTLEWELNAADQTVGGGINDLVTGVTDLTLNGTINVTSAALPVGIWRLFNYSGTLTNNFLDLGTISLGAGNAASIDTATTGQVNLVVAVIPEPNVAALIGALGGILLLRRRR